MHMSDALVSPTVAIATGLISATLIAVSIKKIKENNDENTIPLMGVMGAFIFVAQMINFSIPGTGSSGHIIGGVLLSTILGPWAGFLVLTSVLIIQCLIFADGGLMALGCNILNMGVISCLIAYPLIFRPMMKFPASFGKIMLTSVITCIVALELGAFAVTIETLAAGITALPMNEFILFMLPIHFVIGACEGMATGAVIYYIQKTQPQLLNLRENKHPNHSKFIITIVAVVIILGSIAGFIASSLPDGLEWSISNVATNDFNMSNIFSNTLIPDYEHSLSGIIGSIIVIVLIYISSRLILNRKK